MSDAILRFTEMKISVAVSAALIVQTALALLWSGAAAERLNELERKTSTNAELVVRTARLEEQLSAVRAQLQRIESKIDGEGK